MNAPLTASDLPRGFTFAGMHCGLKKTKLDLGLASQRSARVRRRGVYHQPGGRGAGGFVPRAHAESRTRRFAASS